MPPCAANCHISEQFVVWRIRYSRNSGNAHTVETLAGGERGALDIFLLPPEARIAAKTIGQFGTEEAWAVMDRIQIRARPFANWDAIGDGLTRAAHVGGCPEPERLERL